MTEQTYFNTGAMWAQSTLVVGREQPLVRVLEIVGPPTPSRRIKCIVRQNDAHPERVGKTVWIRRADLVRKYRLA